MKKMIQDQKVIIETNSGPVLGVYKTSLLGRDYASFQGIPYMKAPIGSLRFRDPQLPEKWTKPLDTTFEPVSYCFYHPSFPAKGGQEDAGVLNVYVPVNSSNDLLPVMVYIYGGGFQMGK